MKSNWLPPTLRGLVLALFWAATTWANAATIVVSNANDDTSAGSLRTAITNSTAGGVITFDPTFFATPRIITLGSALPAVSKALTITGPGADKLTIDGASAYRPFSVSFGITAAISGLKVTHALANGYPGGGAIYNQGTLTLSRCVFDSNSAISHTNDPIYGGAVLCNGGTLTAYKCTFSNNVANGLGDPSDPGSGGAMALLGGGRATLANCTFFGNNLGSTNPGASNGGGGALFADTGCLASISFTTMTGNTGGQDGGGAIDYYDQVVQFQTTSLKISNSIFGGNASANAGDVQVGGAGYLPNDNVSCLISNATGLGTFANFGGALNAVALLPGSNALNAGSSATTLTAATTAAATSLTVAEASFIACTPGSYLIKIDSEQMFVTAVNLSANTLTVQRGVNGTTAATHASGAGLTFAADERDLAYVGTPDIGAYESQGYTVAASSGSGQSATVNTAFANPFAALVKDGTALLPGATVTFSTPGSGATGTFTSGSNTAVTSASGIAPEALTAGTVAGNYTVTASLAGVATPASFSLTNTPGTPASFLANAPTGATAGASFSVTVTAYDQFNNVATSYRGTVHFTASDTGATLPADYTFTGTDAGVHTFTGVTLVTAGNQNVATTDKAASALTVSAPVAVTPAAANRLALAQAPSLAATAGIAFATQPVVALEDQYGNIETANNTNTVTVMRSSGTAVLQGGPLSITLVNGVAAFSALSYNRAETITLGFSTDAGAFTATSGSFVVSRGAASQLVLTQAPSATATAGVAFGTQPVVSLQDAFGNVATNDSTDTVTVMASQGTASLQGGPFTVKLANGVASFAGLAYDIAETIGLTFTTSAGSFSGSGGSVTVSPAAASQLGIVQQPSLTATAGAPFATQPVVKLEDAFGNTVTSDNSHTVVVQTGNHGSTSLSGGPVTVALVNGMAAFSGLSYRRAETLNLIFTSAAVSGSAKSSDIAVGPAAASELLATTEPSPAATAGVAFTTQPVLTLEDAFGNVVTSDSSHTVTASINTGTATLQGGPLTVTLANGVAAFANLSYNRAETITLRFDTNAGAFSAGTTNVVVSPAATSQLAVSAPATATAGVAPNFTVTAEDAFGNVTPGYTGTLRFTSTDGAASLPAASSLTSGTGSFQATLRTAGNQTLSAADTSATGVNGTSGSIAVASAATAKFVVMAPPTRTAGQALSYSVSAQDQFGNASPTYTGTVHLTSSDSSATLPADSRLTNGAGSFLATLRSSGSQTLTATDTASASITGTSAAIQISAAAASSLALSAPTTAVAGAAFNVSATAHDTYGNVATSYTGTLHYTATDGAATLPADATLTNGTGVFSVTLVTAGSRTLAVTDTSNAALTAQSNPVAVDPAAASKFVLSAPATATLGHPFSFTVTALDPYQNTATGYTGMAHFSSGDTAATVPAASALTNGTGTFTATLNDAGQQMLTATDTADASVTGKSGAIAVSLNQTPTLNTISDPPHIEEDSGAHVVNLTGISAGGSEMQTLTVTASSDNPTAVPNPVISYSSPQTTGTVTFTPGTAQTGTATITVKVQDDGGTGGGAVDFITRTFTLTVVDVNKAPSFVVGANQSVAQDAGAQTVAGFATSISPGPADEASQTVNFLVSVDQAALFSVPPAISPDGTLTYTPAPTADGTALVTVKLRDNGGTADGGVDTSAAQTFKIAITGFADETGTYNGLVEADPSATPTNQNAGVLKLVVAKTGLFTGTLKIAGQTFALRGHVAKDGTVTFGTKSTATMPLALKGGLSLALSLQVDVAAGMDKLSGTLTNAGEPFGVIDADRALYTAAKNPKAPLMNMVTGPTGILGAYTVIFAAKTAPNAGLTADQYAQGDGIGTLTVSVGGVATLTGRLADGTVVSCANAISKPDATSGGNRWPFYVALAAGKGSISGYSFFRDTAQTSDLDGLGLRWYKPASNAKIYPAGWPAGIETDLLGSKFVLPPASAMKSEFTGLGPVSTGGNALLTLTEGNLPDPGLSKALNISAKNRVTVITRDVDKLTLSTVSRSFTGIFIHPVNKAHDTLRAVIFQKQEFAFGYFLGVSESGAVSISPQ